MDNNNENNNNPESGKTYWEAGRAEQNSALGPETQVPETPEQFYRNYQQQMGGNNDAGQQLEMNRLEPVKKKPKRLTALIIIIVLLLAGGATAYAFRDNLMNAFALMTKSPEEYYAYVENKYVGRNADALATSLEGYDLKQDMAYKVGMDLTYDKDTLSSILQSKYGMSIEDLESYIGLPLDSIGMDMTVALKDSDLYDQIGVSLNQVDLITAEIFLDSIGREMLIRLPELSPAYLRQSLDVEGFDTESFDFSEYDDQLKMIYSDKTADFIKRYADIAISQMKDVKLSKNEELSIDKLSVDCNLLTVTIDSGTMKDIAGKILDEAEEDEYLLELLPMFDTTKEEYLAGIEEARGNLDDGIREEDEVIMKVYVDGSGNIIGRNFEFSGDTLIGYSKIGRKNKEEYKVYMEGPEGNELLSVTGSHTLTEGAYDGKVKVTSDSDTPEEISLTIDYEDARSERVGNRKLAYGTYTLYSPSIPASEVIIKLDVDDGIQQMDLTLQMGSSELLSLHMTTEQLEDFEIPDSDETAEVYDFADIESYKATLDLEGYIADLSEKLGVDVQSILEYFLSSY